MIQLARGAARVVLLTGTLLVNGCGDAHTAARILAPDEAAFLRAFPTAKAMEKAAYTPEQEAALNAAFRGNVSYLAPHQLDRARFPSQREWLVLLEMDPATAAEYSRIERGELKKARDAGLDVGDLLRAVPAEEGEKKGARRRRRAIDAPGCFYNGLRRAANSMGPLTDSRKRAFILARAREVRARGRTMTVASNYREYGIHACARDLDAHRLRVAEVSGDKNTDERARAVDRCNRGRLDVLLLTMGAGGTGIDLKGVDTHVNMESQWNLATRLQANARAVRFGSHEHLPRAQRHVEIFNLLQVKPAEFRKYAEKLKADCDARLPGAADAVLPVPWRGAAAEPAPPAEAAAAEHDKLPAIDVFLYERVLAKAARTQAFADKYLVPNSVEVIGAAATSPRNRRSFFSTAFSFVFFQLTPNRIE